MQIRFFLFITVIAFFSSCTTQKKVVDNKDEIMMTEAPDWSKNANIYEVNIRQYTKEGTFSAFSEHLPRLKSMGVDILWIMPIYPIGIEKRKGDLGSSYSVKDYKGINPDFGNEEDFHNLIDEAHKLGFKVIIDWVANHSAFDNHWAKEHPDWYTQDENGNIIHPKDTDWSDVADLNYDNPKMREAMIDAMKYWVTDFDIDGFRCDVAGFVPYDFWKEAIGELQRLKHLFMLAEWEDPEIHKAGFHMTYGWNLHHIMNNIAKGNMMVSKLDSFMTIDEKRFDFGDYRMNFITNHDENSWNGSAPERFGKAVDAYAVLAFTLEGMPLIYSGQESGLDRKLSFFGKDQIVWGNFSKSMFYKQLLELNHRNKALWNGKYGGTYEHLETNAPKDIFAYKRQKDDHSIIIVINFSKNKKVFSFSDFRGTGLYISPFNKRLYKMEQWSKSKIEIAGYGYIVLESITKSK